MIILRLFALNSNEVYFYHTFHNIELSRVLKDYLLKFN